MKIEVAFSSLKVGYMADYIEVGKKKSIMDDGFIWLIYEVGET
jgi:hypothetical protein